MAVFNTFSVLKPMMKESYSGETAKNAGNKGSNSNKIYKLKMPHKANCQCATCMGAKNAK